MLIEKVDYELMSGNSADPGNRRYKLLRDYPFWYKTQRIIIPEGFEWDGPTGVPLALGMYEMWKQPALIHDFMYSRHGRMPNGLTLTQQEADERFFYHLRLGGVSGFLIIGMRLGLKKLFTRAWDGTNPISKTAMHKTLSPLTISGIVLLLAAIGYFILPLVFLLP